MKKGKGYETRKKILKAARKIFAKHPYHVASIRMVGKEGGFDHPLISYYFPSKEKLFEAVVVEMVEEFDAFEKTLYEGLDDYSLKKGLPIFINRIIDFHYENPELMRTVMQNTAHVEKLEDLPGFELFIDFLIHFMHTMQKTLPIKFSLDEVSRLVYSFSALIINYLGASSSYATILRMEPDSPEYRNWVQETMVLLFFPRLLSIILPDHQAAQQEP
ncbi:MAG: TetR/AcrR family transcriptional regulator [Proteobacteria bacterium]|nr:TetR/AcrR family transcriptional regulator [Pseudomonadota bacterium]